MDKETVLEELKKVQDFDSERNHIECLLLNLVNDEEISDAFMEAEEKTQTGYRTRTIRCGESEPEEIQVMQMIDQIMVQDITDPAKSYPIISAWFQAKYSPDYMTVSTPQWDKTVWGSTPTKEEGEVK